MHHEFRFVRAVKTILFKLWPGGLLSKLYQIAKSKIKCFENKYDDLQFSSNPTIRLSWNFPDSRTDNLTSVQIYICQIWDLVSNTRKKYPNRWLRVVQIIRIIYYYLTIWKTLRKWYNMISRYMPWYHSKGKILIWRYFHVFEAISPIWHINSPKLAQII